MVRSGVFKQIALILFSGLHDYSVGEHQTRQLHEELWFNTDLFSLPRGFYGLVLVVLQ